MGADPAIRIRRESTSKKFPGLQYIETDDSGDSGGNRYSRFNEKVDKVPNLGHGHLHVLKAIEAKYSVIKKALERMDYDKRGFVTTKELLASVELFCGRVNPILWDDIILYCDPSRTGLTDYRRFLDEIRQQVKGSFNDDNSSSISLRSGFNSGRTNDNIVSHVNMQTSNIKKGHSALGSHGSSDVDASMRFLCEKIYEKFSSIRSAFRSLDVDKGGTIGKKELKNILDDCCYQVPEDVFLRCYKEFDSNGDGEIDYGEFMGKVKMIVEPGDNSDSGLSNKLINGDKKHSMAGNKGVAELYKKGNLLGPSHDANEALLFLQQKLAQQTDSVRTAFRLFDQDQTGGIEQEELKRVLDNYAYRMSDQEFENLMKIIDTNKDSKISYEEFMNAIGSAIIPEGPNNDRSASYKNAQNMKRSSIVFG